VTRDDLVVLSARLLVITGAAVAFAWWQQSVAAGLAFGLGLWAVVVMGPGERI
jgi:Flp pilus assembly protein protease CpaA